MSQVELVIAGCREYLDSLPLLRRGLCCFAVRRPGRLTEAFGRRCRAQAGLIGYAERGRPLGPRQFQLLDGPVTSVIGFSWTLLSPGDNGADERLLLNAESKNAVCGAAVDLVVQTFVEDCLPAGTTDAAAVVIVRHPFTSGQEQLTSWLIDAFSRLIRCAKPRMAVTDVPKSGGYQMLLLNFAHLA